MLRLILNVLAALVMLFIPASVSAQLVPCSGVELVGDQPIVTCQACDLVALLNNVLAWLLAVLAVVATIGFVVSGFRMVTSSGNAAEIQAAKRTITNIFVGFVLVLAAWLLVDLIMKMLLKGSFGPWNVIQCVEQPQSLTIDPDVGTSLGSTGGTLLSQNCPMIGPGVFDCASIEQSCRDGSGTPTVDMSDPMQHKVTCAYAPSLAAGNCEIPADPGNPCSPTNPDMISTFGSRVNEAARICSKESGGTPVLSGSDRCCGPSGNCTGAPSFSGGYFQINILSHADKISGCTPGAFFQKNGTDSPQGNCVKRSETVFQKNGLGVCIGWSCEITDMNMYNTCISATQNSATNFAIAKQLYDGRGQKFNDWSVSANSCKVPL